MSFSQGLLLGALGLLLILGGGSLFIETRIAWWLILAFVGLFLVVVGGFVVARALAVQG